MRLDFDTWSRTLVTGLAAALILGGPHAAHGQERESSRLDVAAAPLHLASPAPRTNRSDSLVNGTLIGAAVGFGAGFLTMAVVNAKATDSGPIWSSDNVGYYTGAGIIGAGIGALLGAITDASIRRNARASAGSRSVAVIPVYRRAAYGLRVRWLY